MCPTESPWSSCTAAGEVRSGASALLVKLGLFDVYRGESLGAGARSLAYRLRFCALDRTLTDEEIGALRTGCITAVEGAHRATLR